MPFSRRRLYRGEGGDSLEMIYIAAAKESPNKLAYGCVCVCIESRSASLKVHIAAHHTRNQRLGISFRQLSNFSPMEQIKVDTITTITYKYPKPEV